MLPLALEVRHEARDKDEVERPRASDLVGDVEIALLAYSVLGVLAMMFAADYDCARVGRQWPSPDGPGLGMGVAKVARGL
jgi:hypothetical protein